MMVLVMALVVGGAMLLTRPTSARGGGDSFVDDQLSMVLSRHGFTGTVSSAKEPR